jgi:hypothetical protein
MEACRIFLRILSHQKGEVALFRLLSLLRAVRSLKLFFIDMHTLGFACLCTTMACHVFTREGKKREMISTTSRVALVTGGGRGIGAATARLLAGRGAHVIINYLRNAEAAERVVSTITRAGGSATAMRADFFPALVNEP